MSDLNRVVAHFQDGRLIKGTTQDFLPHREIFHLQPADGGPTEPVNAGDLKALYFVRKFEGDPRRTDLRGFVSSDSATARGNKIAVRFHDGELLCGYALSYTPDRAGFFLLPADTGSNNLRIFVVRSSTAAVRAGAAAEALARQALDPAA